MKLSCIAKNRYLGISELFLCMLLVFEANAYLLEKKIMELRKIIYIFIYIRRRRMKENPSIHSKRIVVLPSFLVFSSLGMDLKIVLSK